MGTDTRTQRSSGRRAARLAAAQVLYELEVAGAAADAVLADHLANRWRQLPADDDGEQPLVVQTPPDAVHLGAVVRGSIARRADLDGMIEGAMEHGWTMGRLEVLLRAILRCGAYELLAMKDVPAKVAITEYVEIAKDFYAGPEPALVNGVLDRLAHVLRPDAFPASGPAA